MSSLSYIDDRRSPNEPGSPDAGLTVWIDRKRSAEKHRSQYEPDWHLAKAFLANKQWVVWQKRLSRVITEPNPQSFERHTVNVITTFIWTMAGKLASDSFMPKLFFREDDETAVEYTRQAQRALEYAWDVEINANAKIFDSIMKMLTYGLSGIICQYDQQQGAHLGQMPLGQDGRAIMDQTEARSYVADQQSQGQQAQFRQLFEGQLSWKVLSPFHILPPPGIENEANFPWLIVDQVLSLDQAKQMYPKATRLGAQALIPIDAKGENNDSDAPPKLNDMVLVSTGYELPTQENPQGRTVVWSQDSLLSEQRKLPYVINGKASIGIAFFKYHVIPNRFWPIGLVEPLIGPQRERNRSRSQYIAMKDRAGLGRVYARPGSLDLSKKPTGKIMELIEVRQGVDYPTETAGTGPGPWIAADIQMHDQDMDRVAGLRETSLGSAPGGVSAYSAMALLAEQDDRRLGPVIRLMREEIKKLVRFTLADMKSYWPPNKQVMLAGQDDALDAFVFNSAQLPLDAYIRVGEGAPVPRNQAAEIQKIFDIYDRSISSGQPLPISWLFESIKLGEPMPLPKKPEEAQERLAENENMLMARGVAVEVHPTDLHPLHVQIHLTALGAGQLVPGMEGYVELLQEHLAMHQQAEQGTGAQTPALQGQFGAMGGMTPGGPTPAGISNQLPNGAFPPPIQYANQMSPRPGGVVAGEGQVGRRF